MYPTPAQSTSHSSSLLPFPRQHPEAPSTSYFSSQSRRQGRHREQHFSFGKTSLQSGLRTPPADEMGTTYQAPNLVSYEGHHHRHSAYDTTAAPNRALPKDTYYDATRHQPLREQDQQYHRQQQIQQSYPQSRPTALSGTASQQSTTSRPSTRPGTPSSGTLSAGTSHRSNPEPSTTARDAAMIQHSLQMPPCIGPKSKGGDLVDLTAQIACMIWFEPINTLEAAEKIRSVPSTSPVRRLTDAALPLPNFKDWVREVLSTTQVTQNVILLALLYIYRLKVTNPTVRGQAGSEYRLLTVALMLGNKFLDDNTYTNKTWAEVSKIDVKEIHVMEVEFLQNMRYNLLASKGDWEEWLVKLAGFREYCDRAQRSAPSPLAIPASGYRSSFASPLPSPTGMLQLTPSSQQSSHALQAYSPTSAVLSSNGTATWQPTYPIGIASSPLDPRPVLQSQSFRKRGLEEDSTDPPAKRISRQPQPQLPRQSQPHMSMPDMSYQSSTQDRYTQPQSTVRSDSVRLPVPSLTLNTNAPTMQSAMAHGTSAGNQYAPQQTSSLSLPPLVPGVRAMSTVFPPTATAFAPQLVLGSTGPAVPPVSAPSLTPMACYPTSNYATPTKRTSPQSSLTPAAAAAYASSPLADSYPHHNLTPMKNMGTASGVHTPMSQSPSVYLQQRASPYKPVRHVNTLLYPPPSAFLHEYHFGNSVPPTQMHYQPLGRREIRTGILPEFADIAMANPNGYGTSLHHLFNMPHQQAHHVQG